VRQTISRSDAIRLISRAREAVCDSKTLQELLDDYGTSSVFDALGEAYAGVSNGFLSQVCEAITGRQSEVTGEPDTRLPCPCCSRRTLGDLFDAALGTGYEICDHCGWEDDGTSNEQDYSSANHGSMAEYRARMSRESNYYVREKWTE
jgi:hypothetical protein